MPDRRPLLLVVDDEPGVLALVERFARGRQDFEVATRTGGHALLAELPAAIGRDRMRQSGLAHDHEACAIAAQQRT